MIPRALRESVWKSEGLKLYEKEEDDEVDNIL
jgi:hypothetical protein